MDALIGTGPVLGEQIVQRQLELPGSVWSWIVAVFGVRWALIGYDLRCRMKAQGDTGLDWHGNSTTHLVPGVPLLTDALKLPDGRTIRLGQRAGVTQVRAE